MQKKFDMGLGAEGDLNQVSIEQLLSLALQRHQSGDLKQAQTIYRNILAMSPNEANALQFLGIAMHQSGDSAGGVKLIERSIVLDPQAVRYSNLGKVLLESGRFEAATRALSRALELDSTSADALNSQGILLRAQKRFDEAVAAFEKAIAINPQHAEAYNNMGSLLEVQGRAKEAGPYYFKAITLMPPNMVTKKILGMAYYSLGEMDKAAEVYRQWLAEEPNNPEARHQLAACTPGAVPTRADNTFIEYTFDAMAENFDKHLGHLDYRAPQLMAETLQRECGAESKKFTILDAGCGTGLCGPLITQYAARLVGVDLSAGMLAKAKLRYVYDTLIKAELTAYLQSQVDAFDIILSADTLNYFGDLEDVLKGARKALRRDGYLFFTLEVSDDEVGSKSESGYRINANGRYSHSEDYLRRTLDEVGFTNLVIETAILRYESHNPQHGFIVSCRVGQQL